MLLLLLMLAFHKQPFRYRLLTCNKPQPDLTKRNAYYPEPLDEKTDDLTRRHLNLTCFGGDQKSMNGYTWIGCIMLAEGDYGRNSTSVEKFQNFLQ